MSFLLNQLRSKQFILLFLIVLSGFILRVWGVSNLGLNHFDEGVYAISGLWSSTTPPEMYVRQILYSPPLYPLMIGIAYLINGSPSDVAAIWVNIIISTLSIVLVWWIGQRWFNPVSGLIAAMLVAFNSFLIAYARMALTDILFGFLFLLSLALIAISFETGKFTWAVLAGISIGMTWNTKYHGWFLIILSGLVLVYMSLFKKISGIDCKRRWLIFLGMSITAFICFIPWLLYAQSQPGGFIALLGYQRSFMRIDWWHNFLTLVQMQIFMDGWLIRFVVPTSFIVAWILSPTHEWKNGIFWLLVVGLAGASVLLSANFLYSLLSIIAIVPMLKTKRYFDLLILGSAAIFLISTPLYRPYPRLMVPWILLTSLIGGYVLGDLLVSFCVSVRNWQKNQFRLLQAGLLMTAVGAWVIVLTQGVTINSQTWLSTNQIRNTALEITRKIEPGKKVFVYGVPELAFYLKTADFAVETIDLPLDHPSNQALYLPGTEVYLITGIYAEKRDPRGIASLQRLKDRLIDIQTYKFQPNDERLLNDFTPSKAAINRLTPNDEYDIHLYLVLPSN